MTHLIIVRHSISEPNPNAVAREWPLSDEGRRLCQPLAEYLSVYRPDIVVSSDEPKAIETGEISAKHLGIPISMMPNLHEHERVGVPWFDSVDVFRREVEGFFAHPDQLVLGQETATQARERFSTAVDDVLAAYSEQNVVIVTHGTVMSLFAGATAGIEPFPFWRRLGMPAFAVFDLPEFGLRQVVERIPPDDCQDG